MNSIVTLDGQVLEDLRERFFGPSFELMSHDKVSTFSNGFEPRQNLWKQQQFLMF